MKDIMKRLEDVQKINRDYNRKPIPDNSVKQFCGCQGEFAYENKI